MKKYIFISVAIYSLIFAGWIEVNGKEVSNNELTILIKEEYAPLLGLEQKLELSSISVLNNAVSGFATKEFEPLFLDYETFTENHRNYNLHRYYSLKIDPQQSFVDFIANISNAPEIELVEYKYKVNFLTTTPNDPLYPDQWAHYNTGEQMVGNSYGVADCDMDTDDAWDITTGDSSIIIAIIDSGIDMDSPEFINRIVSPIDYLDDDNNPDDIFGHALVVQALPLHAAIIMRELLEFAGIAV